MAAEVIVMMSTAATEAAANVAVEAAAWTDIMTAENIDNRYLNEQFYFSICLAFKLSPEQFVYRINLF